MAVQQCAGIAEIILDIISIRIHNRFNQINKINFLYLSFIPPSNQQAPLTQHHVHSHIYYTLTISLILEHITLLIILHITLHKRYTSHYTIHYTSHHTIHSLLRQPSEQI